VRALKVEVEVELEDAPKRIDLGELAQSGSRAMLTAIAVLGPR
jgi:hypothetical protein